MGAATLAVVPALSKKSPAPIYQNPGREMLPSQMLDTLNQGEKEALLLLYNIMPYPDSYAHSPEFFLNNVRTTLRAAEEMSWNVPEREFNHFVLPLRVNNEYLDDARPILYEILKERIKGMSMKDAILEVNHWTHEVATYQPSDQRTSSPLSVISQSTGRCGEESTLLVAALRAAGIPARQIYTPRWAHTDDNHAWVEAWADGEWYFLGACEPAPVLNMAWFNNPASRGMLMHTDVAGNYDGPEEVISRRPLTTTINVTSNYAPTAELRVKVVDKEGNRVEHADVSFCIYNYAEFYPTVTRTVDSASCASIQGGKGDFLVWATDGRNYGFTTATPGDRDGELEITLSYGPEDNTEFDLEIVPPKGSNNTPTPSEDAVALNNRRLSIEDSIRNASAARRFISEREAREAATQLSLDGRTMTDIMRLARGNGSTILTYLRKVGPEQRQHTLRLLSVLPEKDVRDIDTCVISDCLPYLRPDADETIYNYVASPRIEWETLRPFRKIIADRVGKKEMAHWRKNPLRASEWIARNITLDDTGNPAGLRMTPASVVRGNRADQRSRNIFLIAALRSAGIPSRIDPVTSKPQYLSLENGKECWKELPTAASEKNETESDKRAALTIEYRDTTSRLIPRYYTHFTLSKIENGKPYLLEYPDETAITDGEISFEVAPGKYMLISGTRLANGEVMVHGDIFEVSGDTRRILTLRKDSSRLSVIGNLNAENIYHNIDNNTDQSILSTTGRGYYTLLLAKPGDEPTSHILNDLRSISKEFEESGTTMLVLFADEESYSRFDRKAFDGLPKNVVFGIDKDGVCLDELAESLNLASRDLPITVMADTFNRVVFSSQGYTIGLPQTLLNALKVNNM